MAENKTININIKQNADKAEQSFKSYNKELGNTKKQYDAVLKSGKPFDQQLEDINRIVKETPLNVRDMNKQIQAYQSIALSAGRETPVGRKALEEAAQLRDRYIDIQNETKRLADDQRTLEGAMQGVATGVAVYGGIQSAMALSGVESEKLRETLVKLQAAQTLMNSINQVATAFEKESALMLTLKSAKTKAVTVATAAYATVTGTTTGVLKAFRIALASTGIGLLVVGIGLLVANFDKLLGVFKPVIDGFKSIGDAIGLTDFAAEERFEAEQKRHQQTIANAEKELKQIDKLIAKEKERQSQLESLYDTRVRLAKGNSKQIDKIESDRLESRKKSIDEEERLFIEQQKSIRDKLQATLDSQQSKINKANRKRIKVSQRALDIQAQGEERLAELNRQIREKDFTNITDFNIRRKNLELDFNEGVEQRRKERADKYKSYLQERLNAIRKAQDLENSLLKDGIDKELKINQTRVQRLIEDTKKNTKLTREERNRLIELYEEQGQQKAEEIRAKYRQKEIDAERKLRQQIEADENAFLDEIAEIEEANYQATLSDQERELRAVQDKYFRLQELAQGNAEQLNIIEEARMNAENEIYIKYQNEQYDIAKENSDKRKALDKAEQDYKINVIQGGLSAINDIAELFAKGNEKQQKRAFQIQKAVGIAQATINTAQAITKVFAETTDFTPTQSLRIANAVAIGVAGAAQIAAIASQQFQGGGDVESPTSISAGGEAVAPQFNVVGDSGVNQLAQIQQQPVQAYVVSGEVTTSQALDRNRVENATL